MINEIIAYESGELGPDDVIHFFGDLVSSGVIHGLQGSYQRTASDLIEQGILSEDGEVL